MVRPKKGRPIQMTKIKEYLNRYYTLIIAKGSRFGSLDSLALTASITRGPCPKKGRPIQMVKIKEYLNRFYTLIIAKGSRFGSLDTLALTATITRGPCPKKGRHCFKKAKVFVPLHLC